MVTHIVNVSGGKDSAACYLLAVERGRPFRAVMADTGNEHPVTVEYAQSLPDLTGGPQVEIVRADFTDRIARKRQFVSTKWREKGVPEDSVERALSVLVPTGNPFLDLCIWKGRFPSRKAQFCTEFLKSEAVEQGIIGPALAQGPVIQWLGVRRAESLNRRRAPMWQVVRRPGRHAMRLYRPLIHWTAQNVFSYAAHHGLPPNPLYLQGMGRVGCFPCINSNKSELAAIARRFPEAFDRIAEWEAVVKDASKRGAATFFAPDATPEGAQLSRDIKRIEDDGERAAAVANAPWPRAHDVAAWAQTDRGGRQMPLELEPDDGLSCSSQYGLCE